MHPRRPGIVDRAGGRRFRGGRRPLRSSRRRIRTTSCDGLSQLVPSAAGRRTRQELRPSAQALKPLGHLTASTRDPGTSVVVDPPALAMQQRGHAERSLTYLRAMAPIAVTGTARGRRRPLPSRGGADRPPARGVDLAGRLAWRRASKTQTAQHESTAGAASMSRAPAGARCDRRSERALVTIELMCDEVERLHAALADEGSAAPATMIDVRPRDDRAGAARHASTSTQAGASDMKAAVYYENGRPRRPQVRGRARPAAATRAACVIDVQAIGIEGGDVLNRAGGALRRDAAHRRLQLRRRHPRGRRRGDRSQARRPRHGADAPRLARRAGVAFRPAQTWLVPDGVDVRAGGVRAGRVGHGARLRLRVRPAAGAARRCSSRPARAASASRACSSRSAPARRSSRPPAATTKLERLQASSASTTASTTARRTSSRRCGELTGGKGVRPRRRLRRRRHARGQHPVRSPTAAARSPSAT